MRILIKMLFKLLFVIYIIYFFLLPNTQAKEKNSIRDSSVDYELSYPGILPDNKFYLLKALRDKIIERLIRNEVKKIEFDLLMADKTIYASKLLADKGEAALAKKTALKGENYFTILVSDYKWAYWRHNVIPGELDSKIKIAAKKHQEVFRMILKNISPADKSTFAAVLDYSQRNLKEFEKFKLSSRAQVEGIQNSKK